MESYLIGKKEKKTEKEVTGTASYFTVIAPYAIYLSADVHAYCDTTCYSSLTSACYLHFFNISGLLTVIPDGDLHKYIRRMSMRVF